MKVVFLARLAREAIEQKLAAMGDLDVVVTESPKEAADALAGARVLITGDVRGADGKLIADALRGPGRTLEWIQFVSIGYEGLVGQGLPKELLLTNQGGAVAPAVAEHAMALMLALLRRIPDAVRAQAMHAWVNGLTTKTGALEGRNLAIIGFGNIGKALAKRARAFDMRILGVSRSGTADPLADEMHPLTALSDVLARADAVVLSLPLNKDSERLIGARELARCRKGAIVVNVSRGAILDQGALADALTRGMIAGAGLDVADPEPLPPDHALWTAPNLLITPHIGGGGSPASRKRIADMVADNIARFQRGAALMHRVS